MQERGGWDPVRHQNSLMRHLKELMGFHSLQDRGMGEILKDILKGSKQLKTPLLTSLENQCTLAKCLEYPIAAFMYLKWA